MSSNFKNGASVYVIQFSKVIGPFMVVFGWVSIVSSLSVGSYVLEFSVCDLGPLGIDLSVLVDGVSIMFGGVVLSISGSVFLYSSWYMSGEIFYRRFVMLVWVFVVSILVLIFVPNLLVLLVGWDGLGITSFLLVVYYQNSNSVSAGMLTALTNRIGDVLILACVGLLFIEGGWIVYGYEFGVINGWAPLVFLIGAVTNSAQVPFSAWLPAAIAAPTPVSALVHSSTLVTAGVYLLYRCLSSWILEDWLCMSCLKFLSLVTLVMAGSAALMETDFKNVIALSTLSQLSMMLVSLSLGLSAVCFFHIVVHAMFNALLFLCAGVVIHANGGSQDLRLLGKGWAEWPVSISCMLVASMSLCGVPFLSGFYSNDLVVELSFISGDSVVFYVLEMLGVFCTLIYSWRLMVSVFWGANKSVLSGVNSKESVELLGSYFSLLLSSIISGVVLSNWITLLGVSVFILSVDNELVVYLLALGLVIVGVYNSWPWKWMSNLWIWFISGMWNFKYISSQPWVTGVLSYSDLLSSALDQGWLERVGPQGGYSLLEKLIKMNQVVQGYFFLRVMGVLLILVLGVVVLFWI